MIDLETARRIAYDWHGGGGSPLYSFASTSNDGQVQNVTQDTVQEVDECLYIESEEEVIQPDTPESDLYDLRDFLVTHLPAEEERED